MKIKKREIPKIIFLSDNKWVNGKYIKKKFIPLRNFLKKAFWVSVFLLLGHGLDFSEHVISRKNVVIMILSAVAIIFYDEFIPEKGERRIKDEGYTFNNVLETVNRNREFNGEPPVLTFCFANSEKVDNELFLYYGLVKPAMLMRERGEEYHIFKDKGILLIDMVNSPISKRKGDTFLYGKANKDNRFADMAIGNEFDIDKGVRIRDRVQMMQYKPICVVGEICIYKHKSKYDYQVCFKISGSPPTYRVTEMELLRFKQKYRYLIKALYEDAIYFEDYSAYILFDRYLKYS